MGGDSENPAPDELPISEELRKSLTGWTYAFDDSLNFSSPHDSVFSNEKEEQAYFKKFYADGIELIDRLRGELGNEYEIVDDLRMRYKKYL